MRTFSVIVALVLTFVRCSAPDTCVRTSDCQDGEQCVKGACFPANATENVEAPAALTADASTD